MYSLENRLYAIKLYLELGNNTALTVRRLGYPDVTSLAHWVDEYQRNQSLHTQKPNSKWLTDITEFAIPAGKIYLSPIIDYFDGTMTTWTAGVSPKATLVNEMLDKAIVLLGKYKHPVLHSDRGCHYQWSGWIERVENAGLTRSMSKKGCPSGNSAYEGFFGP